MLILFFEIKLLKVIMNIGVLSLGNMELAKIVLYFLR